MSEEIAAADANIREIQRLRGLLAASQERERIAVETLNVADDMANTLVAYFNKRGVAHSERKGNEDIAAMADALSNYGPLRYDEMTKRAALEVPERNMSSE